MVYIYSARLLTKRIRISSITVPFSNKPNYIGIRKYGKFHGLKRNLTSFYETYGNVALCIATLFCFASLIESHLFSITLVTGFSMQPTLNPKDSKRKDWVVLRKRQVWRCGDLRRGDIVTYRATRDPNSRNIKRIVALEGDTVTTLGYKNRVVVVPKGHCWVEGDNHSVSDDSNKVGPIPLGLITGHAKMIVYPLTRTQFLTRKFPHSRVKVDPYTHDPELSDLPTIVTPKNLPYNLS